MCELVEVLKSKISSECHGGKCTKEGRNVSLEDTPSPHLLIDMDCSALEIPPGSRRCDFLYVGCEGTRGAGRVVPLELKSGSPRATDTDIVEQLRAGEQFAQARIPAQHKPTFLPVTVYGGKLHRAESDKLKKSRIPFRGKTYEISLKRCKTPMKNILRKKA